jgi:hypothetical protein
MVTQADLPTCFCWTRMGTEGGELLSEIVERKERERTATGGTFLWGIGNSVATSIRRLVEVDRRPEVLFSLTRTRPRKVDASPDRRVVWTSAVTPDGQLYRMPRGTRVMGGVIDGRRLPARFALVCESDQPLELRDLGSVDFQLLRNLVSGRPLGASQVTAVVSRVGSLDGEGGRRYQVAMRAALVEPYVVRLTEPIVVDDRHAIERDGPRLWERLASERTGMRPQLALPGFDRVRS